MAAALPGEIYLTTDVATAMCPTERVSGAEKSDLVLDCSRRPLCLVLNFITSVQAWANGVHC